MQVREPVNILLVDDQPAKLLTYEVMLRDLGENLIRANSGKEAFEHLLKTDIAVVLVDVCMPELDGFELVTMLRQHPRFEHTAVIFISAIHQSEYDLLRGYESGAVDYVSVPVVPELLRAKVRIFVDLHRKTRQLEQLNSELERRVAERTAALESSTAMLRESEERLRLASEAADFGTYDYNVQTDRLHCSPPLKRLLNTSIEGELSLDEFVALCHPDDRDAVRTSMISAGQGTTRREIEYRVPLEGGRVRWLLDRGASLGATGAEKQSATRVMGTVVDITKRKQAESNQLLLMAELDHRVKNILANVIAMARLSSKGANSVESFVDSLDGRIQSMARAHRLLRESNWSGANLEKLAKVALQPFRSRLSNNIELRGDSLSLSPKLAQSLSLVFHELATNAVKYGALSSPTGRVVVEWEHMKSTQSFRLSWQESGGPAVKVPANRGFGLTVLDSIAGETGARVDTIFDKGGLRCVIAGPLENYYVEGRGKQNAVEQKRVKPIKPLDGGSWRVLIVEDEPLVALYLQSALERAGHQVIGPAYSLSDGLELAAEQVIDAALLDVRLGRDLSAPIADHLVSKGIPIVFTTGYSDSAWVPEHLKAVPRLTKPYQSDAVLELLGELVRRPEQSATRAAS